VGECLGRISIEVFAANTRWEEEENVNISTLIFNSENSK
jgi:hypothetical protein